MAGDICHWNINGLKCKKSINYKEKINFLSSLLENTNSTILLNVQETHLTNENELPNFVNLYKHIYNFENAFAKSDDPYSGILVGIRKTETILLTEIIEQGRLIYIKFQNNASKEIFNLFSIYCNPSNSEKQIQLITKLRNKILIDNLAVEDCIILGDLNFVNSILDRNSQTLNRTDTATSKIWDAFEDENDFQDALRIINPSRRIYSFESKRDKKIKARLDRVYISSNLVGRVLSNNFISTKLSDHKMIKVKLAAIIEKGPGLWIFNNSLLRNLEYKSEINDMIDTTMNQSENFGSHKMFFDFLKQKVGSFSKEFSKKKAEESNKEFYRDKKELETLEGLHIQKLTPIILERIEVLKNKIEDHQRKKIQGALLRSKLPNFEENDPKIAFLNRLEKRKGEENTIFSIYDEESSTIKSDSNEIKETIFNFYSKLYKRENEDITLQAEFLDKIDKKVDSNDMADLERDLSERELFEALKSLGKDKTPGPDGLTREWFIEFWEKIKIPYMRCVKEIKETEELSEMQKRGAIKISHKKDERNRLKNYRPITLLNIDLKIITKALAERLKKVLPDLVHPNQTCVPGRHIENNIHLIQNLIDHVNAKNEKLALLFFDQEKAFDRNSHLYTLKTLKKFGFGENFIGWIKILYKDIYSFVKVNGFETYEFPIERGVRQGCPLSPLLYVLTFETLNNYIRKNKKIKGYQYTWKNMQPVEHKSVQYADDMNVGVTSMSALDELMKTLEKYERATNAKINKDKTEALWVGKWRNRQDNPHNLKWKNDYVKFLGIYIGNKVGANGTKQLSELNFAEQIEKIKNKMNYWKGKGLPLTSRIKIVNIFILSRLWHRTQIWNITKNHQVILDRMVRNFVWNDKQGCTVRQGVLQLQYEKGGLQLVDINCKIKVQRIKRIMYLLSINDDENFERFLADSLIGNYLGQSGLSYGLITHKNRIKFIQNEFYRYALDIANSLNIIMKPGNITLIHNEPLFYNLLFLDTNNAVFTLSRFKNQMPKTIKELQSFPHSRQPIISETVRKLRISTSNINITEKVSNNFYVKVDDELIDISKPKSKTLYLVILGKKNEIREWETRMGTYLQTTEINWEQKWQNLHNRINNSYVKSALWEMYHLNFWSGFRARERCQLCKNYEQDMTHILNDCPILKAILEHFDLHNKYNTKMKRTFGLDNDKQTNFLLYQIKSVVFRSRFLVFGNIELCKTYLINKCKRNIEKDIKIKFNLAKFNGEMEEFTNIFMSNNQQNCISVTLIENDDIAINY